MVLHRDNLSHPAGTAENLGQRIEAQNGGEIGDNLIRSPGVRTA